MHSLKLFFLTPCVLLMLIFSCGEKVTEYHSVVLTGEEYIQIGPHDSLQLISGGNWCFEIFFTVDTLEFPENRALFSINDAAQNTIMTINMLHDSISFWYSLFGSDTIMNAEIIKPVWENGFHFMAINFNYLNNRVDLWIDEMKLGTWNAYTSPIPESADMMFFFVGNSFSQNTGIFAGLIDECRLWNKTLTDDLIDFHSKNPDKLTLHYDRLKTDIGLLSIWRFNHDYGLTAPDEGRGGIDAVIIAPSNRIYRSSYRALPH